MTNICFYIGVNTLFTLEGIFEKSQWTQALRPIFGVKNQQFQREATRE